MREWGFEVENQIITFWHNSDMEHLIWKRDKTDEC
jgi:hypothetical protein